MPDSNMKPEEAEKLRPQWKKGGYPIRKEPENSVPNGTTALFSVSTRIVSF